NRRKQVSDYTSHRETPAPSARSGAWSRGPRSRKHNDLQAGSKRTPPDTFLACGLPLWIGERNERGLTASIRFHSGAGGKPAEHTSRLARGRKLGSVSRRNASSQ